jgi:hypothetical protein
MTLIFCHNGRGEVDHGGKTPSCLVGSWCDPAPLLERSRLKVPASAAWWKSLRRVAEEVFDEMTPFGYFEVARNRASPVPLRRDDGAPLIQRGAQPIIGEGLVAEKNVEFDVLDQGFDRSCRWPGKTTKRPRLPRPAPRSWWAGRIGQSPDFESPLAPAPCWWTRMIVPSMIAYSNSGSPDRRLKVAFQLPNGTPRSRQGAPGRSGARLRKPVIRRRPAAITRFAETKRRSSHPLRVAQHKPHQSRLHFRSLDSKFPLRWNPLCKCPQALGQLQKEFS